MWLREKWNVNWLKCKHLNLETGKAPSQLRHADTCQTTGLHETLWLPPPISPASLRCPGSFMEAFSGRVLALCPPGALVSVESTQHPFLETITRHLVHVCGVLICKTPNLFFGQPGNLGSPQPCGEITGDSRLTVPRGASGISVLFPHSVCVWGGGGT